MKKDCTSCCMGYNVCEELKKLGMGKCCVDCNHPDRQEPDVNRCTGCASPKSVCDTKKNMGLGACCGKCKHQ